MYINMCGVYFLALDFDYERLTGAKRFNDDFRFISKKIVEGFFYPREAWIIVTNYGATRIHTWIKEFQTTFC